MHKLGVIAIGRNEGERLVRCLESILNQIPQNIPVVYVDSGSTDDSVSMAQSIGIHVAELDQSVPFTMARGRNAGFNYLVDLVPDLEFVQFIDGDCELCPGWLERGIAALNQDSDLAIACGRRHERFPDASPYNRLADMEWNTLIGETSACGGDFIARVQAIQSVNGFNSSLICGEEPEMCIRLRQQGWKILRVDADMTLHDAAMTHFGQWWKRSIRGGWYVAEGRAMYGYTSEAYQVREANSGWLWGLIVPSLMMSLVWPTHGWSLLLVLSYIYLMIRVYRYRRQVYSDRPDHARIYAFFCVLSKLPQMLGQLKYKTVRWSKQSATLIEYKSVSN